MTTARTFMASVSICLVVACTPGAPENDETVDRSQIRDIGTEQFREALEAERGNVLLVNLWATWCAPCLKEIPELIELEHEYGERGFSLLGISLDDIDERDRVAEFRDQWFPEFYTYHTAESDWFELTDMIDPQWNSLLPTSFVLNREGKLVETLSGGKDFETFAAAIEPHL